ncbi:MAG: threonylcarbamoyl-AMP synthase [Bacteroidota bacterium]|nr:threonylcarbamoyl-AMP synthase [Bacteroidota bacterium]MDX5429658.1 threonylcarbamoyl-AMP synthase [Bacteroidota bacterium]MDX5468439.1 threonylcarbamoyl-AMP synthase [Bacteroidota bacterium]
MKLEIHPVDPEARKIAQAVEIIQRGGVVIFPTDTIYALGCDLNNNKAIERVCRILGKKPERANLSLICADLRDLSTYTSPINSVVFKLMKHCLPGPYTFILKASREVPKLFQTNKKTVGIRVPDNKIIHALLEQLGHPLVSASVHAEDEIIDYLTDPEEIYEKFASQIDLLIDGGAGDNEPSTIIDCVDGEPILIREGKGEVDL